MVQYSLHNVVFFFFIERPKPIPEEAQAVSPKKPEEAANGTANLKDQAPIITERSAEGPGEVGDKEEGELGDAKSD